MSLVLSHYASVGRATSRACLSVCLSALVLKDGEESAGGKCKSNVSMVNWLADCTFDLNYRMAWRVRIKFSVIKPKKLLQA